MSLPVVRTQPLRSTGRASKRGSLTIAGTTKVAGTAGPCRVFLHDATDDLWIGFRRSAADGTYLFDDLAAGTYYLVILDDRSDVKRAKVEHVIL